MAFVEQELKIGPASMICDLCKARTKKRMVIEDIKCVICKKSKGTMKQDFPDLEINSNSFSGGSNNKHNEHWFHPFCAFTSGDSYFLKDMTLMQGLKQKDLDDTTKKKQCTFCKLLDQQLLFDYRSNKYFHSMCAWLKGCKFELKFTEDKGF